MVQRRTFHIYVSSDRHAVKKLDPRARDATFVGYSLQSKGYKVWDSQLQKFVISRDVYFEEQPNKCEESKSAKLDVKLTDPESVSDDAEHVEDEEGSTSAISGSENTPIEPEHDQSEPSIEEPTLRRSSRNRKPPGEWWKTGSTPSSSNPEARETALLVNFDVPNSYSEATSPENIDFWMPGIAKEENSIRENKTFSLVERKPNMHVIPCRYVFRKRNGAPKVRLVAKGYRQVQGMEYVETYAPVVSLSAVRCFLAYVAHLDLECDQMDVVTAFLNGDLEETIYMDVPQGFSDASTENMVCLLHKAIYGLKQAPRQWHAKINSFLIDDLQFRSCSYEPCLYIRHKSDSITIIILYVDDLLIAGSDRAIVRNVKYEFAERYKMKDLGQASEFLGINITRNRSDKAIQISQSSYIDKVLDRFHMSDANTSPTPMTSAPLIDNGQSQGSMTHFPYRQAIGSLMYVMLGTRPDIAFSVGCLARYSENPQPDHWTAVKRILRYLKGTRNCTIQYGGSGLFEAIGYSDSDWAGCHESRKSTEGFIFLIGGGAVTWRSKKQTVVAMSSCEAEYIAASSGSREAIWLSRMLGELTGTFSPKSITVLIDNQGAIDLTNSSSINSRNKHIDIRYHFVRNAIKEKTVMLKQAC